MRNTNPYFAAAAAILFTGFTANHAQGAAVIYESFSTFPDILLAGNAAGTGLTGNWSNPDGRWRQSSDVSYGSLQTTGSSVTNNGGWTSASASVNTSAAYTNLLADGGEMWFSATVSSAATGNRSYFSLSTDGAGASNGQISGSGGQGIGFGFASNSNIYAKVWDTNAWDGGNLQGRPTGATGGSAYTAGTTYLVVGRVQWGATATDADTLSLYLPDTDLTLGSVVATDTGIIANQGAFDTIGFNSLNPSTYDEIRFGATSADVIPIPEPSTALLGGLGFLVLLRRRR